ncbi:MAG: Fe-S protein assembly chaperone HscA [Bacteroidetes bacterium]|nr:MAG: Fe-S protein assembly chaperone HscA [Bacteroidota bacterium]
MPSISINIKSGTLQNKDYILGIDLGTTNSLVAVMDGDQAEPKALKGKGQHVIVPSLIHFGPEGQVIVGEAAKPFIVDHPERTVYSVKRLMGKSYGDLGSHSDYFGYKIIDEQDDSLVKIKIDDRFYTPIELSSLILKELKNRAEQELGGSVSKAVITVPAYFNDAQRQATRDAGKLAGLEVLRIVNEPTAASLAYGLGLDREQDHHVAVYDLGGGTFDVSILRISNGIFEVLSTHGDTYLGGDDFDRAVVEHWLGQIPQGVELSNSETQALRLKAEEAKKALSKADLSESSLEIQGQQYHFSLSKAEFNQLIAPILQRTLDACARALKDSELKLEEIDSAVLVGGSTRSEAVKEAVAGFFKHSELNDSLNPDEVVALGAAIEADILAGNRKDILLLDVTPLSLGIETLGGLMDTIIPRNSKVPNRVGKEYTTSVDGQVNMKISVYQGERELVSENRKLAEFTLQGIPAMPAGMPKIQVNFMLNADGILQVQATELRSGVKQHIEVKPQYGLTDEEVERMLLDSITHAESDVKTRMVVEAKTEAEQILYVTERFIAKNKNLLSDQEIQSTSLLLNDLKNSLESNDKDIILGHIDELNEYTRPFAERLMDRSVSEALKGKSIDS